MPFPGARAPDKDYDTMELLFIGVNFAQKGEPGLLQAFARLRSAVPNAKLHVVGQGSWILYRMG